MRKRKLKKTKYFKPPSSKFFVVTTQKLVWPLVALSVTLLIAWTYLSGFFNVKKTLCISGERPCGEAISAEINKLIGQNILTFRASVLEQKLKKADISIQNVTTAISLPSTIKVSLSSRNDFSTLAAATDSATIFVDQNLVPFKVEKKSSTPAQIFSPLVSNLELGEQITNPIILSAIKLTQSLNDNFISFKFITIHSDRLQVVLKNNQQALFSHLDNYSISVPSLQLILSRATIEPKPKTIDLRFKKPVLRF